MTLYDTLQHFLKKIFYAEIRYSSQEGSGLLPTIVLIQKLSFGLDGGFLSLNVFDVKAYRLLLNYTFCNMQQHLTTHVDHLWNEE